MNIQCAPIQGYTDYVWRRAHADMFPSVECYYTPFLRIERGEMRKRDLVDVAPENNSGYRVVPQILGCPPEQAVRLATAMRDMGYEEVDVNLGCPYPPLALHHKGSGLLAYPDEAEALFRALSDVSGLRYSVKMRLGWDNPAQWEGVAPLLDILSPTQVTIHPRVGRHQYRGELNLDEFARAVDAIGAPVVYNGDIKCADDAESIMERYPKLKGVMIGRALIEDPALLCPERATSENYRAFHDAIFDDYRDRMNGNDKQLITKMKAFWEMYLPSAPKRNRKAVLKANNLDRYNAAVSELFVAFDKDED